MTVNDRLDLLYPVLENDGEVRLLTLIPENNVPIRTTLSKASLKDVNGSIPKYTALSYVWGPPAPRRSITCNGVEITVTANLEAAFVQLRHSSQERVIWVDQLCINQNDYKERNQQVSMMGRIYSMAEQVAVWLGPSDKDTPMLWNLLLDLTSLRDFAKTEVYDLALRNKSPSPSWTNSETDVNAKVQSLALHDAQKKLPDLPPATHPLWRAVKRFLGRPWFFRIWTFQEVILSKKCMVWCGEFYMSWHLLQNACLAIENTGFDISAGIQQNITYVGTPNSRFMAGNTSSLRSLLEANRVRAATEPRDMIYALRSIIDPQLAKQIDVDYRSALGVAYARAARFCIVSEKALTVLGSVEYRRTEESRNEMPSWVPDWRYRTSVNVDLSMRRFDQSKFFSACSNEPPRLASDQDERRLVLKGFVVATLIAFYDVKTHLKFEEHTDSGRFPPQRFQLDKWKTMYKTASSRLHFPASSIKQPEQADHLMASIWSKSISYPLTEEQTLEMAYRRTITADLFPRPKTRLNDREIQIGFPAYTAWQDLGHPDPVPTEVLHEHDYYVTQVMFNRVFFTAKDDTSSYMGIVMGVPRVGDCVCILLGGDTPFVLRPKGRDEWELVADAYVHGIMDGEAMGRTVEDGFEYQDFTLV
ncbi:heterokaryon incompatibility protein-domain-containing protein [Usnea florida]